MENKVFLGYNLWTAFFLPAGTYGQWRSVEPGGLPGGEPEKKSSSVNSYGSDLIFDFWKGMVTHEIVETLLKEMDARDKRTLQNVA